MCRVSRSFLRFSQLELFAIRKELDELVQLADYVCYREFPHLLLITNDDSTSLVSEKLPKGSPQRYIALYREIATRCAALVCEWLRVGYVQGNMNSDNTLLGIQYPCNILILHHN